MLAVGMIGAIWSSVSPDFGKESVCCGIELKPGEESVALFVVLNDGYPELTDNMKSRIREAVAQSATRHHVPKFIACVDDIPRTKSGKIVEVAVKNVLNGNEVKNINSLANQESLNHFYKFKQRY